MKEKIYTMPSNIALIKYMGKKDPQLKTPANISLSLTLPKIYTQVSLCQSPQDKWSPISQTSDPQYLKAEAQQRFFKHAHFVQERIGVKQEALHIKSGNNFPSCSGIASSASSFAALTLAVCKHYDVHISNEQISELSRQGSGSSCRSFYSHFACWNGLHGESITIDQNILAVVALVESNEKKVSSSKAHELVKELTFFRQRAINANSRYSTLITELNNNNWSNCYKIVNDEWKEMHKMFSMCQEPFTYLTDKSHSIINIVDKFWRDHNTGPLITFDAGPNCHLLFNNKQQLKVLDEIKKIAPILITRDFSNERN